MRRVTRPAATSPSSAPPSAARRPGALYGFDAASSRLAVIAARRRYIADLARNGTLELSRHQPSAMLCGTGFLQARTACGASDGCGKAMIWHARSGEGDLLATASLDGTMRAWNARSGRLLRVRAHPDAVLDIDFDATGRRIATSDATGVTRTWDFCTACGDADALARLADQRRTRGLTAAERQVFLAE